MKTRLVALLTALVAALPAAGATAAEPFPPGWTHAEINVTVNGESHTLIYDKGRVRAISPSQVVLRERDGSIVTIPLSPSTEIRLGARLVAARAIPRGAQAVTLRVDGGPATRLRATR